MGDKVGWLGAYTKSTLDTIKSLSCSVTRNFISLSFKLIYCMGSKLKVAAVTSYKFVLRWEVPGIALRYRCVRAGPKISGGSEKNS